MDREDMVSFDSMVHSEAGHEVRRLSYKEELYVSLEDFLEALLNIRDASWSAGYCAAAMTMETVVNVLSGELFRDN